MLGICGCDAAWLMKSWGREGGSGEPGAGYLSQGAVLTARSAIMRNGSHAVGDALHSCLAVCGKPQSGSHREQTELANIMHCLRENELCMPTDGSGFALKPGYAIFAR